MSDMSIQQCWISEKEGILSFHALLFPYVQNMIAHLVVDAGLPPLMLGMAKMDVDDIAITKNS